MSYLGFDRNDLADILNQKDEYGKNIVSDEELKNALDTVESSASSTVNALDSMINSLEVMNLDMPKDENSLLREELSERIKYLNNVKTVFSAIENGAHLYEYLIAENQEEKREVVVEFVDSAADSFVYAVTNWLFTGLIASTIGVTCTAEAVIVGVGATAVATVASNSVDFKTTIELVYKIILPISDEPVKLVAKQIALRGGEVDIYNITDGNYSELHPIDEDRPYIFIGHDGDSEIIVPNSPNGTITGMGGNDLIKVSGLSYAGTQMVFDGGSGDDEFWCSNADDTIIGGDGFDTVYYDGSGDFNENDFNSIEKTYVNLSKDGILVQKCNSPEKDSITEVENIVLGYKDDNIIIEQSALSTFSEEVNIDMGFSETAEGDILTFHNFDTGLTFSGGILNGAKITTTNVETILGTSFSDEIDLSGVVLTSGFRVDGGAGDDVFRGNGLEGTYFGGDDNDTFETTEGNDRFEGGDGWDTYDVRGAEHQVVIDYNPYRPYDFRKVYDDGFGTEDTLGEDVEEILGSDNGDYMELTLSKIQSVIAGSGDDTIVASLDGMKIDGGAGDDILTGRDGDDILIGGVGNNVISGGEGSDEIILSEGFDLVDGGDDFDTVRYEGVSSDLNVFVHSAAGAGFNAQNEVGDDIVNVEKIIAGSGQDLIDFTDYNFSGLFSNYGVTEIGNYSSIGISFENFEKLRATALSDEIWLSTMGDIVEVDTGAGADLVYGGNGALVARGGSSVVDDKEQIDVLNYSLLSAGQSVGVKAIGATSVLIDGGPFTSFCEISGFEQVYGSNGNDAFDFSCLEPGAGIEVFESHGLNVMIGSSGDDVFNGGSDDDIFYSSAGRDEFIGNGGSDIYDFSRVEQSVKIICTTKDTQAERYILNDGFGCGEETLSKSVEIIIGSNNGDEIRAKYTGVKTIMGGSGDDYLSASISGSTIIGGAGKDAVVGSDKVDYLYGGDGNDYLSGGGGGDHYYGGSGVDLFCANKGDTIHDFEGAGSAYGDFIVIRYDGNTMKSGFQEITKIGSGLGKFEFTDLEDGRTKVYLKRSTIYVSREAITFYIDDGDVMASEYTMDDFVYLPSGVDYKNLTIGSFEDDNFQFSSSVGEGKAGYLGLKGDDVVHGGVGDDYFLGESGDDVFFASDGVDQFDGGVGTDTYNFSNANGGVEIKNTTILNDGFGNKETLSKDVEIIVGSSGVDVVNLGNSETRTVYGGDGDDVLTARVATSYDISNNGGKAQYSWLYGEGGDDYLKGSNGVDYLYGGDGNDTIYGSGGVDYLYGEDGDDYLKSGGRNHLFGGSGNDIFVVRNGDTIHDFEGAGSEIGDLIKLSGFDANTYVDGIQDVSGYGTDIGQFYIWDDIFSDRTMVGVNTVSRPYIRTWEFIVAIDDGDLKASAYSVDDFIIGDQPVAVQPVTSSDMASAGLIGADASDDVNLGFVAEVVSVEDAGRDLFGVSGEADGFVVSNMDIVHLFSQEEGDFILLDGIDACDDEGFQQVSGVGSQKGQLWFEDDVETDMTVVKINVDDIEGFDVAFFIDDGAVGSSVYSQDDFRYS